MSTRDSGRSSRRSTGRTNRRRFLAGIAAAGLTPPLVARAATTAIAAQGQGGTIVAQQTDGAVTTDTLAVPGASLWYEVSGSGPVLLLIPGGALDADSFGPIVGPLAENYTVVRYDPRGISRSPLDGPAEDVAVEVHADDAQRLLREIGDAPAYILGSSGGAVIGLALATHHAAQVRTLVAHEPPLESLLPAGSPYRGGNQAIYDAYRAEGIGPAMEMFFATAGLDEAGPPSEPSPEMEAATAGAAQNFEFFIAHYLMPITSYQPDIEALRGGSSRVVVGVGEATVGQEAHETALALAERLGTEAVAFPRDHLGFVTEADAFAEKLQAVLQAS
jgi:pimeloyl-ACP methyl ester carboxylesterase